MVGLNRNVRDGERPELRWLRLVLGAIGGASLVFNLMVIINHVPAFKNWGQLAISLYNADAEIGIVIGGLYALVYELGKRPAIQVPDRRPDPDLNSSPVPNPPTGLPKEQNENDSGESNEAATDRITEVTGSNSKTSFNVRRGIEETTNPRRPTEQAPMRMER
jgi:hypothetical protein